MGCGIPSTRKYEHEITLDGRTICRDGREVRVRVHRPSGDLEVGCTYVSRAALMRLAEIAANNTTVDNWAVTQEGK